MTVRLRKLAGVCGWPIHHSLSPLIHNFWLQKMNIMGGYVHFAVRPDKAEYAFSTLPRTSIVGVNVTQPLKRSAYKSAQSATPQAEKLGVANCLIVRGGALLAHNTDIEGFTKPLLAKMGAQMIKNSAALVIGTGGAAAAVLGGLLELGSPEIRLCGRTDEKAQLIASRLNRPNVHAVPWAQRQNSVASVGLIINATSGGMKGRAPLDINLVHAGPGTVIYDLVYTPLITPLMRQASELGLPFVSGLDMLIEQARPSFKLFYAEQPPVAFDPKPLLIKTLKIRKH